MPTFDPTLPWYHGSPLKLTHLTVGSSISQNRDLARAFSHKPSILSMENDGRIRHNGTKAGFLYIVDEPLCSDDLIPHPHPANAAGWEWLTTREVSVRLLEATTPRSEERFNEEEWAEMQRRLQAHGGQTCQESIPDA